MSPTEAKFHEDLEAIASQLDLGVQSGKYSWADVQERLKSQTGALARSTSEYVRENTWTSLGVAAMMGVLIGLLVPRR